MKSVVDIVVPIDTSELVERHRDEYGNQILTVGLDRFIIGAEFDEHGMVDGYTWSVQSGMQTEVDFIQWDTLWSDGSIGDDAEHRARYALTVWYNAMVDGLEVSD